MALFKLLVGQFIQADPDSPELTAEQIKTGARRPSKTYNQGQTVKSDVDLVTQHGDQKFVLISGVPKKGKAPVSQGVAPGGQVSSGFQSATGTPEGTVSGLADPSEIKTPEETETPPNQDQPLVTNDGLESMSNSQLKSLAEDEGIALHGANSKAALIDAIRTARND